MEEEAKLPEDEGSRCSGQIIVVVTSHGSLGPQKVAFWKGNPFVSGKSTRS